MTRHLIVNADDFGQSTGINEGVIRAHRHGVVTSASLMVRWPAAVAAAALAGEHPALSVGLHVDLGQWSHNGTSWVADYIVVDVDDEQAVGEEVSRQINRFVALVGQAPTHLDGHQHVQRSDPVRAVMAAAAADLGVPLRLHSGPAYSGVLYGQTAKGEPYPEGLRLDTVVAALRDLGAGWHELGCHPGLGDDAPACYRTERTVETALLCDARLRDAIAGAGLELRSFASFRPADRPRPALATGIRPDDIS